MTSISLHTGFPHRGNELSYDGYERKELRWFPMRFPKTPEHAGTVKYVAVWDSEGFMVNTAKLDNPVIMEPGKTFILTNLNLK